MSAIGRFFARRYLTRASKEHLAQYPQIACHAFDLITTYVMLDGQYERDELDLLAKSVFPDLPPHGTCLDVGANIGNHSLHFAGHFSRVISLEPHPRNFGLLQMNAQLAENVHPLNIGASDRAGTIDIVEDRTNLAASSIHRSAGRDGRVVPFNLVRIDDIPEVQEADAITFIKFDIEGHEATAIAGAQDTIRRHRPVVMLEILKDEISEGSAASLDALRTLGYTHFLEPVEKGLIGRAPRKIKKLLRSLKAITTLRRVSKADKLVRIDRLEPRNYLMVICSTEPLRSVG